VNDPVFEFDSDALLERLDTSSPDALLSSIAAEFARLNRVCAGFAARLAALEASRATIDRVVADGAALAAQELPASFTAEASFALPASGFYEMLYDAAGRPYRWTAPEFSFEFFLDRSRPARFTLRFARSYAKAPSKIRCFADTEEIPVELLPAGSGYELRGTLPPRPTGGGSVLSFLAPAASPAEVENGEDERPRGLAFESLKVSLVELAERAAGAAAPPPGGRTRTRREPAAPAGASD
jgi:hypothetical protein